MCKVYNSIGSLTTIKSHLHRHNINEFKSLNEVIAFQKDYFTYRQQITSTHEVLIEQEKRTLSIDISQLDNSIKTEKINVERELRNELEILKQKLNDLSSSTSANFIQRLANSLKKWFLKRKIRNKELCVDSKIADSIRTLVEVHSEKNNRYQYIVSHFTEAVNDFALENNAGLVIIIPKKHNWFEGIFGHKHTKALAFHTSIPLMAIHA